jgi:hypothetical protein
VKHSFLIVAALLVAVLSPRPSLARPVLYADSTSAMVEYGAGDMKDVQILYAPEFYLSFGLGHLEVDAPGGGARHEMTYARVNYLAKRWNMEAAQANIFFWGGAGKAEVELWVPEGSVVPPPSEHDHDLNPGNTVGYWATIKANGWNAGGQVDYETRRIYALLKTDAYRSDAFTMRTDVVQFGFAPYEHEANTLATFFVLSGTRSTGNAHNISELALLLRLFKKRVWFEAGVTTDREVRASAMFSL